MTSAMTCRLSAADQSSVTPWLFLRLFYFTVMTGYDGQSQMTQFLSISLIKMLCFRNQLNSFHLILKLRFVSDRKKDLFLLYLEFSILMFWFLPLILGVGFCAFISLEKIIGDFFYNGWKTCFSNFGSF